VRWVFQHWYVINRPEKVLSARQNIGEVQNFSARWRLRFVLHWNKTFGESWRGLPRLWPSKFFRCEFRKWLKTVSAGGAHLKLCPMQIRCNGQKRADWKYVFYTENFTARLFREKTSCTFRSIVRNLPVAIFLRPFPCRCARLNRIQSSLPFPQTHK